ncbi:DUF4352 domain-containing protein [Saccharopolyspora oryzae]|uniref:DUF4352 domain-containing protein n=1 Tax=Saccharopolyspora oryzae TaxID=2997343 RepID=A0ABT4V9L6_9PSEU|nr:DUF4352 domain-containing protein [Saccharopolyspora oryzae]MDA3630643.1 DUF4352 domain-containing protein [Saccharopolyspora oryzae]
MKRLIAPLAAALVIGLAGCGPAVPTVPKTSTDSSSSESGSSETGEASGETTGGPVAFGESVEVKKDAGAKLKVSIAAPADLDPAQASFPPEVGKYVAVDASAELLAGTVDNISDDEFTLVDAQGNRYEAATVTLDNMFLHLLTEGEPVSGKIVYDVPADATGFTVEYAPTDANEKPMGVLATWK